MKNVTITLPDDIAKKAKVFAAQHNTSVSKYVGALLEKQLKIDEQYQAGKYRWQAREPKILNESRSHYPSRESLHDR